MRISSSIFTFLFLLCLTGAGFQSKAAFPVTAGGDYTAAGTPGVTGEDELTHNRLVLNRLFHYSTINTENQSISTERTSTFLLLGSMGLLAPCIVFFSGRQKRKTVTLSGTTTR